MVFKSRKTERFPNAFGAPHLTQTCFWRMQFFGWLLYIFFVYITYHIDQGQPALYVTSYYLLEAVIGCILTLFIRYVFKWVWQRAIWLQLVIGLIAVFSTALLWTAIKINLSVYLLGNNFDRPLIHMTLEWLPNSLTIMACWTAIYSAFKYRISFFENQADLLKAESDAKDAQLRMLRYQLNPHFLFNTLASISGLIGQKETAIAKTMTNELSYFLRRSLDIQPLNLVTVNAEFSHLQLYLNIEKVRFAERLCFSFDVTPEVEDAVLPSMLLQPFAENAIKHRVSKSITTVTIEFKVYKDDDQLIMEIINDCHPDQEEINYDSDRMGIGHVNTQERLSYFFKDNFSFSAKDSDGKYRVKISIPFSKEEISH